MRALPDPADRIEIVFQSIARHRLDDDPRSVGQRAIREQTTKTNL
jgi:hypothetical protein